MKIYEHKIMPAVIGRKCDTCGKESSSYFIPITLTLDLYIDDTEYDFCSLQCLKQFVDAEIKKEN